MRYEYIVGDVVSDEVAAELPEMAHCPFPTGGTSIFGPLRDESDVLTLLARITALGLTVLAVRRLPD